MVIIYVNRARIVGSNVNHIIRKVVFSVNFNGFNHFYFMKMGETTATDTVLNSLFYCLLKCLYKGNDTSVFNFTVSYTKPLPSTIHYP